MEHIRLTAISLSLLLCTVSAFAQRHYENIPALELNYGTNLFGNAGNYYNLSFSRYINRTSYWKAGLSYFEKPYEYTPNLPQVSKKVMRPRLLSPASSLQAASQLRRNLKPPQERLWLSAFSVR